LTLEIRENIRELRDRREKGEKDRQTERERERERDK